MTGLPFSPACATGEDADSETPVENSENSAPRERRSYIGIGGAVGLEGGETGLGSGGFSVVSRIGITDNISFHNSTIIGEQTSFMPALTVGLPIRGADNAYVSVYPFIGAGVSIATSEDFEVDPLLVTGADIPLGDRLMSTTRINVGFGEKKTDVGLIFGLGYRL